MNRDDIILSCQQIVNNLVKKYNNHQSDEDLQSEGMIAVVECVDRCLDEGMDDLDQIQARCNVWARNRILTEIYKERVKYSDDENVVDLMEDTSDMTELLMYLEQVMTPRQKEVFDLLWQGYSQKEIQKKLNITQPTYYEHLRNIKKIIKHQP